MLSLKHLCVVFDFNFEKKNLRNIYLKSSSIHAKKKRLFCKIKLLFWSITDAFRFIDKLFYLANSFIFDVLAAKHYHVVLTTNEQHYSFTFDTKKMNVQLQILQKKILSFKLSQWIFYYNIYSSTFVYYDILIRPEQHTIKWRRGKILFCCDTLWKVVEWLSLRIRIQLHVFAFVVFFFSHLIKHQCQDSLLYYARGLNRAFVKKYKIN